MGKDKSEDDIIATDNSGPEVIPDTALENVDGGITLDNGIKFSAKMSGIDAETITAVSAKDMLGGGLAETIYAGMSDDIMGGFSKLKR